MQRVLVTGATGFIGRHVVPELIHLGYDVVVTGRDGSRASQFPWFEKVRFVACDIDEQNTYSAEQFYCPTVVVHLAWPGLPNYRSLFHTERNMMNSYHFLKALISTGVRQVAVTGTCLEYGLQNGRLSASSSTYPVTPYALAKDTLRKLLEHLQKELPFALQWARLFYMYGSGQNTNSLLSQLDRAIDKGETDFNMSGGEQLRDYLPVEEVAIRLAALIHDQSRQGVSNICSGVPISVRQFVENHIARRGASIRLNLGHYPYPDYEPMAFWGG